MDTLTNEWDLKESRKPQFTADATEQKLILPEAHGRKAAVTFFQKISLFSHWVKFKTPVKGATHKKGHSFLKEVDFNTGRIQHDKAFASETNLAWRHYRGNIEKFILIDNVTNNIIWTYYGATDRYPYDVKFIPYQGSMILSQYNYYDWVKDAYVNVNIMRDYVGALQEKIELNMQYHKQLWNDNAKKQVRGELQAARKVQSETSGHEVEKHNEKRVGRRIEELTNYSKPLENLTQTIHNKFNINK